MADPTNAHTLTVYVTGKHTVDIHPSEGLKHMVATMRNHGKPLQILIACNTIAYKHLQTTSLRLGRPCETHVFWIPDTYYSPVEPAAKAPVTAANYFDALEEEEE